MTDTPAEISAEATPARSQRPPAPPPRSVFTTSRDGLRLHASVHGPEGATALPVVCLPGLARTTQDFQELALALSADPDRPRRVAALDYRGRGLSDYDRDWKNYDIKVENDDIFQQLAALGIGRAVFVGTSRGGLHAMAMGAAHPALVRGVVLNDIGPVVEASGLMRIRGYVGRMPTPRNYAEGAEILERLFGVQFTLFGPTDWERMARRTWKEERGGLVTNYDPALAKTLDALDLEAPLPVLWPYFDALKHAPVLVIRGEHSDILSDRTVAEMTARHPACEAMIVPGQGHAPVLGAPETITRIKRLIARAEAA